MITDAEADPGAAVGPHLRRTVGADLCAAATGDVEVGHRQAVTDGGLQGTAAVDPGRADGPVRPVVDLHPAGVQAGDTDQQVAGVAELVLTDAGGRAGDRRGVGVGDAQTAGIGVVGRRMRVQRLTERAVGLLEQDRGPPVVGGDGSLGAFAVSAPRGLVEMSPQPVGRDFPAGRVVVYEPAPTPMTAASAGRETVPATRVPAARLRATREAAQRDRGRGGRPERARPGGAGARREGRRGWTRTWWRGRSRAGVAALPWGVSSGMKTGYAGGWGEEPRPWERSQC